MKDALTKKAARGRPSSSVLLRILLVLEPGLALRAALTGCLRLTLSVLLVVAIFLILVHGRYSSE